MLTNGSNQEAFNLKSDNAPSGSINPEIQALINIDTRRRLTSLEEVNVERVSSIVVRDDESRGVNLIRPRKDRLESQNISDGGYRRCHLNRSPCFR